MWEVINRTSYAAAKSWTRDKDGVHLWLVAVKATFSIDPSGKLTLADEQAPPLLAPEFWGAPDTTSLRYEADVVPPKPATDVLLIGSAHAPKGRAVSKVEVSLQAPEINKTLWVYGERAYQQNILGRLESTSSQPFVTRPIKYEYAYGGADLSDPDPRRQRYEARNPVGRGVAADPRKLFSTPAHSVEYPSRDVSEQVPAGFGPIASFWSPRRERGGTYDEAWLKRRKPLLPDDYSDQHLLCAPEDQRPAQHLRGDERILLTNLTPHGRLLFALPKLRFAFTSYFGARKHEHRGLLGAVIIEPDLMRLEMVWNTSLAVGSRDVDYLDRTVITEEPHL